MARIEPLVIGCDWTNYLGIQWNSVAADLTGWQVTLDFFYAGQNPSEELNPSDILLTLESDGGEGFSMISPTVAPQFAIVLTGEQTTELDPSPLRLPGPGRKLTMRARRTDGSTNLFLGDYPVPVKA